MQGLSIFQGESLKRLLQGAAVGVVASMVIGFSWGGWMTGGTANKLAADQADTAVMRLYAGLCGESPAEQRCESESGNPKKISTNWEQGEYLEKGGSARPPGLLPRLPAGQGVCREVGPSQNCSPMS